MDVKSITFSEATSEWIHGHAEIRKAKSSLRGDRTMLKRILPVLGSLKIDRIRPHHIEHLIRLCLNDGLSKETANKHLQVINSIFNHQLRHGKLFYNPMVAVAKIKEDEKGFAFWTRQDAEKFLSFTEKKYRGTDLEAIHLIYLVALNTGMRRGELVALQWGCVDLTHQLITVRRSYRVHERSFAETTKGRKTRHIPINDDLKDALAPLQSINSTDLVFRNGDTMIDPDNLYHRHYLQDIAEAGVERIRFHDLRHTFASHYMMNGGSLYDLQKILGHSDIKLTERYAHLSKDYLVGKANVVNFGGEAHVIQVNFDRKIG